MNCPFCGQEGKQVNNGHNRSGTQRVLCRTCGKTHTLEPKRREISEKVRENAIKMYYSGVSGRGVANYFGFNKSNVVRWLKKTEH
jgi:transposase-like protein